jgi:hypothetical protein
VNGTLTNTIPELIGSSNQITGDSNTALLGSVHLRNTDVSGDVTNLHDSDLNNMHNIVNGDHNTSAIGSISLE